MADRPTTLAATNGIAMEEDTFERDLKEMLQDEPGIGDYSSTLQLGATNSTANVDLGSGVQRPLPTSISATAVPRGFTSPSAPTAPATTDIPLSSPSSRSLPSSTPSPKSPGSNVPLNTKLENIKEWSINTFKCTKQLLSERLGKGSRTVDVELETQIEGLRETQRKYANILRLARALTSHFTNVVQTQRQLGEAFGEMSQKTPELQEEFSYNSETQKVLSKNGETLLGALNFFTSSVNTLCHKTMEDTILTIKNYESARLEYDAYKGDFETLKNGPRDTGTIAKLDDAQRKFDAHRQKFEKLRADVSIKLKFLEENKVKVMHKQLLLFHNAVSAYFSGNQTALESTLKQFNIKLKPPNTDKPSWIEQ